jgi:hypothetical protein
MQTDSKRKDPKTAGRLGLVAGPFGFLYIGWRYAVAGIVVFGVLFGVSTSLLNLPSWLILANLPVFGVLAYRTCTALNRLVDSGRHRSARASESLPVAVFAMTRELPLVAAVSAGALGVTNAFSQFSGGHLGGALFTTVLVIPIFMVASFLVGAMVAAGIDYGVLRADPAASRHIFPPWIGLGE